MNIIKWKYILKKILEYHELNLTNNVEICWLFSRSKCQFRFRGTSRIELDKYNLHHWEKQSEPSRSMCSCPKPSNH